MPYLGDRSGGAGACCVVDRFGAECVSAMSSSVQLTCKLAAAHRAAVWCQALAAVSRRKPGLWQHSSQSARGGTAPRVGLSGALEGPAPEQVEWRSRRVQN